jgi:hypothetical protein
MNTTPDLANLPDLVFTVPNPASVEIRRLRHENSRARSKRHELEAQLRRTCDELASALAELAELKAARADG